MTLEWALLVAVLVYLTYRAVRYFQWWWNWHKQVSWAAPKPPRIRGERTYRECTDECNTP